MGKEIINKVAKSPIITFDLEEYCPKGERLKIDCNKLSKMNKQFHIQNGYIIAIPEDDDKGRVIIEKV